jgi:BolA protein
MALLLSQYTSTTKALIPTATATARFAGIVSLKQQSSALFSSSAGSSVSGSSGGTSWVGPVQESVQQRLMDTFAPTHLQVINESHGQQTDESHFKVIIVSSAFEGQKLVQRHRMVNTALQDPDSPASLPFHALTITAKSPDQWDQDSSVPESPKCMGGGH